MAAHPHHAKIAPPLRRRLLALLAVAALIPLPAAAQTEGEYQRIYLATNSGHFLYWTFNPNEAEADAPEMVRHCGGVMASRVSCFSVSVEGYTAYQFSFNPLSRALNRVSWGPGSPLRFRLALTSDGSTPPAGVQMVGFTGSKFIYSSIATQVEPGIWEGEMTDAGTLGPTESMQMSLRVLYPSGPAATPRTIRLATAGQSWLELPTPVVGRSLADMKRASPAPAQPSFFRTDLRTYTFSDTNWQAFSFEGDLSQPMDFAVPVAERAQVMGVVEMFDEPAVYEAMRRGEVSPERLTDAPTTQLLRNGVPIAAGANSRTENAGRGSDTVAAVDVGAGNVTLRVTPAQFSTDFSAVGGDNRYKAYVVVVYGDRTLSSYRASYMPRHSVQTPPARVPGSVGTCQHQSEMLPTSAATAAVSAVISWDAVTPMQTWTHNFSSGYGSYPCSEVGTGTSITTVVSPRARVLAYGVTLAAHNLSTSQRDVVIDERIDFIYNP